MNAVLYGSNLGLCHLIWTLLPFSSASVTILNLTFIINILTLIKVERCYQLILGFYFSTMTVNQAVIL